MKKILLIILFLFECASIRHTIIPPRTFERIDEEDGSITYIYRIGNTRYCVPGNAHNDNDARNKAEKKSQDLIMRYLTNKDYKKVDINRDFIIDEEEEQMLPK